MSKLIPSKLRIMKTAVLLFMLLLLSLAIQAQTKKAAPANLYQQALELYAENNFKDCVAKLDRIQKTSPKPDAKVLYLKIKAIYQLCQTSETYYTSFEQAFNLFKDVAPKQNYSPIKIQEIAGLEPQIQIINEAKAKRAQRLLAVRDSLKADSIRQAIVATVYDKSVQLYDENKWIDCFTLLSTIDTLLVEPDVNVSYLKIKALYPIFSELPTYQTALEESFVTFADISEKRFFPPEKKLEISDLQKSFTDKVQQIEAERARNAEIARMYQHAEQLYETDKLEDCVTQLEELETFTNTQDAKILYLKIKALYPLYQKEEKYKTALNQALPLFLQLAENQHTPTRKVAEIKQVQEKLGVK